MSGDGATDALARLRDDLAAEVAALASVVDPLDEAALLTPTPAEGWTVADQLAHLAAFDEHGATAIGDPDRFRAELAEALERGEHPVEVATQRGRGLGAVACRDWWHDASAALAGAAAGLEPRQRLPWYGPDMGAMSFVTARLMETWAHGQDVRDALGVPPEVSPRLRHVADIGVRARPFSFVVRDLPPPEEPIRVELTGPDGERWTWGPEDASDVVRGDALEFCLVVVQRRNLADTALEVTGSASTAWMAIAQAFAGAPGPGRAPLG